MKPIYASRLSLLVVITGLLVALSVPAIAQEFDRKFVSEPGLDLVFDLADIRPSYTKRMDYDGDGIPDVVTLRDENGITTGLRIVDVGAREEVYRIAEEGIRALFGEGRLRVLAIQELDDESRGLIVLKAIDDGAGKAEDDGFPDSSIRGLVCDTLFFYNLNTRTLLGSLPPKITGGSGKTDESAITVLENIAVADLDGDDRLDVVAQDSATGVIEVWGFMEAGTGVNTEELIGQSLTRLMQSYPNPFREETHIGYEVESAGHVELILYDLLGREVQTLVRGNQPAGLHRATWDGRDLAGNPVSAGAYFYQLNVDGEPVASRQMVRVR